MIRLLEHELRHRNNMRSSFGKSVDPWIAKKILDNRAVFQ